MMIVNNLDDFSQYRKSLVGVLANPQDELTVCSIFKSSIAKSAHYLDSIMLFFLDRSRKRGSREVFDKVDRLTGRFHLRAQLTDTPANFSKEKTGSLIA
jgi:hypothetical protein